MVLNFAQKSDIIKRNPNKERIKQARDISNKLRLHVDGTGMAEALERCDYFENPELYKVRHKYAISNKDLFGRLLHQEEMVFSAKGGSASFNLGDAQETKMNALLSAVRYGMPLRNWIRDFALKAYRCDPAGVIYMEIDAKIPAGNDPLIDKPRTYPTYKSIHSIYDYDMVGRRLQYICFRLTAGEAIAFGVVDADLDNFPINNLSKYYRIVDDSTDEILKWDGAEVLPSNVQAIAIPWKRTPGFIISDLMKYDDPKTFLSPLDLTVELADVFLSSRSIRDLQQRYHGFSKAIEPQLSCPVCDGEKYIDGNACKACTPAGSTVPTGFKLHTKVADVARFPLALADTSFDWRRFFGYVTPDVEGWNKQDESLEKLELLIDTTYWGASQNKQVVGVGKGQKTQETATKTMADLQPRYARLNKTADWAEKTEMLIADYIGEYSFNAYEKGIIAYGRYYVLETPDDLIEQYQNAIIVGAPMATLYELLEKYYHSVYQNSPSELAVHLKLLYVEPFPHSSLVIAKSLASDILDFNCKLYFGEWLSTMQDIQIITIETAELRNLLRIYVTAKNIPDPVDPKALNKPTN